MHYICLILSLLGYCSLCFVLSHGKKIAFYPAISVSFITILGFVAGLAGHMQSAYNIAFAAGLLLLPLCAIAILLLRKHFTNLKLSAFYPIICFVVGCAAITVVLNGRFLFDYDDFSHWGKIARQMSAYMRLPQASDMLSHATYPPGSALFIAFCTNVLGNAADNYLIAQAIMLISFLISIFAFSEKLWYRLLITPLLAAIMLYNTMIEALSVDNLLAAVSIAAMAICFVQKSDFHRCMLPVALLLSVLILIKNSGVFLAMIILCYAVILCLKGRKLGWLSIICLLIPIGAFVAWKLYCGQMFEDVGKHALSLKYYSEMLEEKQQSGTIETLRVVLPLLFRPSQNHALYLIPGFICSGILLRKDKHCKRVIGFISLFFVVYEIGVMLMYVLSMPVHEVLSQNGRDYYRYNGTMVAIMVAVQIYLVAELLQNIQDRTIVRRIGLLAVGCAILCVSGYGLSLNDKPIKSLEYRTEKHDSIVQLMHIAASENPIERDDPVVVLFDEKEDEDYHTYAAAYYLGSENIHCCYDEDEMNQTYAGMPWGYWVDLREGKLELPKETTVGVELFTHSADESYVNMLDTVGYQQNTRYSRWNSGDIIAAGWDTTGYIPAVPGDVIRLDQISWYPSNDNEGHGSIYWYDTDLNFLDKLESADTQKLAEWEAVYDESGNIVQFTIPKSINGSSAFIRLTCQDICDVSVITVNQEFVDALEMDSADIL